MIDLYVTDRGELTPAGRTMLTKIRDAIDRVLAPAHDDNTSMSCMVDLGHPQGHPHCYTCNVAGAVLHALSGWDVDEDMP